MHRIYACRALQIWPACVENGKTLSSAVPKISPKSEKAKYGSGYLGWL